MTVKQDIATQQLKERPDYSKRNRKLEWRSQWFHLHRPESDRQLIAILDEALKLKRKKIREQIQTADHRAGYAPAGAGTPWFSIGPPETWVGKYRPDDEPSGSDAEKLSDWMLWYRIESIKL